MTSLGESQWSMEGEGMFLFDAMSERHSDETEYYSRNF